MFLLSETRSFTVFFLFSSFLNFFLVLCFVVVHDDARMLEWEDVYPLRAVLLHRPTLTESVNAGVTLTFVKSGRV